MKWQGTLIRFQSVLSHRLSFDATPDQKERRWQKLVKGDILSKLEFQPLCNGCKTSTVSLPQMTTVWPGPRHLYFVTLTPSAAVFAALWFSFFFSTIRPTGTVLHKRLLLVLSDVWQLNCFFACPRLSAANKQQSPRDSAGDYQQPDFIDVANRVYYMGSEVMHFLITSGGACRRGWLERKGGGGQERLSHLFPKKKKGEEWWPSLSLRVLGIGRVYTCNLSLKACHRQSQPFIMFVKSLISFRPRSNWLQMGSSPVLFC